MSTKALVTLTIGDKTISEFNVFRPTWEKYAAQHGYDLVVIDSYLDDAPIARCRAANWQKLLVCRDKRVAGYEDAVWLDSDILINFHNAPCIVAANQAAPDKVGLVSHRQAYYSNPEIRDNLVQRMGSGDIADLYAAAKLDPVEDYSNTGVMVFKPALHAQLFEHVYASYEENSGSAKEETPLSHYLYGNGLANAIDPRFNRLWVYEVAQKYPILLNIGARAKELLMVSSATSVWLNSYFTHFTGDHLKWQGGDYVMREDVRFVAQGLADVRSFRNFDLSRL